SQEIMSEAKLYEKLKNWPKLKSLQSIPPAPIDHSTLVALSRAAGSATAGSRSGSTEQGRAPKWPEGRIGAEPGGSVETEEGGGGRPRPAEHKMKQVRN